MSNYKVWMDLEMSGLNPAYDKILEIATVVTDNNLEIIAMGPNLVINQEQSLLDGMDDWNKDHHGNSGLTHEVITSDISEQDAEQETLLFLKDYLIKGASPLCGNSISQDRRFLRRYMPELANFFHYRNIDVTSIKILTEMWRPDIRFSKDNSSSHRALHDTLESIKELKFYQENFFNILS